MNLSNRFAQLMRDRRGAFAVLFALAFPILLVAGGLALDVTRTLQARVNAADAADAATLAAASRLALGELTEDEAETLATEFFRAQLSQGVGMVGDIAAHDDVTVMASLNEAGGSRTAEVRMTARGAIRPVFPITRLETGLMRYSAQSVSVSSSESHSPLSMALVLDESGSMGWCGDTSFYRGWVCHYLNRPIRMESLKAAVTTMTDRLAAADPDAQYIRLGGVSYSSGITGRQRLEWGTRPAAQFVSRLDPNGNTDAADAIDWAARELVRSSETSAHTSRGHGEPTRVMVLMTDGESNPRSAHRKSLDACRAAAENGIEIYTVAFRSGTLGEELLSACATSPDNYYLATDAEELADAFEDIGSRAAKAIVRLAR